jgi:hypothetical protein
MKLAITICAVVLAGCNSCQPPPPVQATASDQAIYTKLVEAGCLAPSDGGVQAVHEELAMDARPAWANCLSNGGTVADCNVPCK